MSRAALATVIAVGLLVGVAGAAAASDAPPPAPSLKFYGAQLHVLWGGNTSADVDRQLDLLAAASSNSARVDVAWSSLQDGGRGTFSSWYRDRVDYLVAGASARGIALVLALTETPCWASSAPESLKQGCAGAYWDRGVTKYAPVNVADYAAAASYVAARYGTRIAALELWNEPNYNDQGYTTFATADRVGTYAAMVRAAYPAVKAASPKLTVLAGALSFADDVFLRGLYAAGIRGHYDAISVHPYNEWRAPGAAHDRAWYKYDYVLGMAAIRATMLAAGDPSQVWVTEFGYTTCTAGSDRWCVTEAQQAAYLASAARLAATWPWVSAFIAYNLRDKGTDRTDTEDNFGLVRADYTAKPALAALGTTFAEFAAATATALPADGSAADTAGSVPPPPAAAVAATRGLRPARATPTDPAGRSASSQTELALTRRTTAGTPSLVLRARQKLAAAASLSTARRALATR